jgi:hypothetical protein
VEYHPGPVPRGNRNGRQQPGPIDVQQVGLNLRYQRRNVVDQVGHFRAKAHDISRGFVPEAVPAASDAVNSHATLSELVSEWTHARNAGMHFPVPASPR